PGLAQERVPVVHHGLQALQRRDGLPVVRTDECFDYRSHWPSSTCLPSSSTRSQTGSSAACATIRLSRVDLPEPGSPPASRLRYIIGTYTGCPNSSMPTNTGSNIDSTGPTGTPSPPGSAVAIRVGITRLLLSRRYRSGTLAGCGLPLVIWRRLVG